MPSTRTSPASRRGDLERGGQLVGQLPEREGRTRADEAVCSWPSAALRAVVGAVRGCGDDDTPATPRARRAGFRPTDQRVLGHRPVPDRHPGQHPAAATECAPSAARSTPRTAKTCRDRHWRTRLVRRHRQQQKRSPPPTRRFSVAGAPGRDRRERGSPSPACGSVHQRMPDGTMRRLRHGGRRRPAPSERKALVSAVAEAARHSLRLTGLRRRFGRHPPARIVARRSQRPPVDHL